MNGRPQPAGVSGRDQGGRFGPGNRFGVGNPNNKKVQVLRNALLQAVSEDDVTAVVAKLIELARGGDLQAIKELLDRTIGRPSAHLELSTAEAQQRVEEMTDDELLALTRAEGGGR